MFRSRNERRRLAARTRRPVRLNLESLEERLTPSGPQTAGSYTDLVNAIAADTASNTNYVIQITNSFTFNAGGQVSISKLGSGSTLTIEGQNGTNYTLTGNGNRLFDINGADQNVTFVELTLTGGTVTSANSTANGGAVRAEGGGSVTLSSVTIENDSVTGYQGAGGGISVWGGGNLTIKNGSLIQSNNVTASNIAEGGGICVWGPSTVLISDSTISKNSVTGGEGANGASPGASGATGCVVFGGGLFVSGNGWTVTLTGDTLSGNTLAAGNGGNGAAGQNATGTDASGGNGGQGGQGGVANGGGAYFWAWDKVTSHLTISDDPNAPTANPSEFLDNSIQAGAGGNGGAGGTSTGTAKNANGGNGGWASEGNGGGIYISAASGGTIQATINNTTFSGNKVTAAKGGAGGAAGIGGTGSAGAAGATQGGSIAEGGAIAMEKGSVSSINDSTITNNSAVASTDVSGFANGGGIFDLLGGLTLTKVTLQSNTASGSSAQGGGLSVSGGNLTIQGGSLVQSNRVTAAISALGGGIYTTGGTTVIRDSTFTKNIAQGERGADGAGPGANGAPGGYAEGGGLDAGPGGTATLLGVTLSGNSAIGGDGGKGAAGGNASGSNATGSNGGNGGTGGGAEAGAANVGCKLTILADPSAPTEYPSLMIDNTAESGSGGNGGAGGGSTGTANNSNGGNGGSGPGANGGALSCGSTSATISNTAFYGNKVLGGNAGLGGAAGTGGSGSAGTAGATPDPDECYGGGLDLGQSNLGSITLVNDTVAKNTVTAGNSNGLQGYALGGGVNASNFTAANFDNNTITQNTTSGGIEAVGSGVYVPSSNLTLVNNLIQGNQSPVHSANEFETFGSTLSNASNNFITSINANAVSTATNMIGNSQPQLGNVVGVDSSGNPTGGPIYYPLLPGVVSIGAGSASVLSTIATAEGTTPASATDEIGNPRTNNGAISLGAVEIPPAPPPPSPAQSPPSPPSPPAPPALNVPPLLALFDILLGGTETVNANDTETIIDSIFGIPLIVSTFDGNGNLMSVDLFGIDITFLFG